MGRTGNESFIDKRISLSLKGFAIIMMVIGHSMGHPEYWIIPFASNTVINLAPFFRMLSRMSVGVFTFLAGYSCYKSGLTEKHIEQRIGALKKLLTHYWFQTFVVFLPLGLIFGKYTITVSGMFYNITGFKEALILFAWYVPFFVTTVLALVPIMKQILRGGFVQDLIVAIAAGLLIRGFFYLVRGYSEYLYIICDWSGYYTVYMMGYLTAKHSLFEKLQVLIEKKAPFTKNLSCRYFICVIGLIAVLIMRYYVKGITVLSFESIYVFAFVYCLVQLLIEYNKRNMAANKKQMLVELGKISTDIWFVHALFFSAYTKNATQKCIIWLPGGVLKTLAVFAISIAIAFALNYIINCIFFRKKTDMQEIIKHET